MPPWASVVLAGCAVAVSIAVVLAVLSARRALDRTAAVLAAIEHEVTPLADESRALAADARALTQEVSREVERAGDVVEQLHHAMSGVSRLVGAAAGLTRAGQLLAFLAALRRGEDVFVERLRTNGGNHHGH